MVAQFSTILRMVESACNAGNLGFDPWVGKILWRRKWQPTPVCLPGEPHGRRSLVGYSPWDCKESDMTERLSTGIYKKRRLKKMKCRDSWYGAHITQGIHTRVTQLPGLGAVSLIPTVAMLAECVKPCGSLVSVFLTVLFKMELLLPMLATL